MAVTFPGGKSTSRSTVFLPIFQYSQSDRILLVRATVTSLLSLLLKYVADAMPSLWVLVVLVMLVQMADESGEAGMIGVQMW
jgi:hypothetical protein